MINVGKYSLHSSHLGFAETNKLMVGALKMDGWEIDSFPFGSRPIFSCENVILLGFSRRVTKEGGVGIFTKYVGITSTKWLDSHEWGRLMFTLLI